MNGFGEIIGNEQVIKTLKRVAADNSVFHAYIFEGAEGSGKKLLANSFAKFLFCQTKHENCSCHSCIQFDSGNHSDLYYIRRGKEKTLGVELVRSEVLDELYKKPFEYERKVFIIEEAHLLTVSAQNALLRSIEEPPEYALIILLAKSSQSFLPTIRSRCFIYKMRAFGSDFLYKHLVSKGHETDKSLIASECSDSIGGALALYGDDTFFEMRREINDSLAILNGSKNDLGALFDRALILEQYKEQKGFFAELALLWFRDVLAYKATGDLSMIRQKDYQAQIAAFARSFSFKSLYKKLDGLMEFTASLAANAQFPAALDALAIRLTD